jgi:hypothetical protein
MSPTSSLFPIEILIQLLMCTLYLAVDCLMTLTQNMKHMCVIGSSHAVVSLTWHSTPHSLIFQAKIMKALYTELRPMGLAGTHWDSPTQQRSNRSMYFHLPALQCHHAIYIIESSLDLQALFITPPFTRSHWWIHAVPKPVTHISIRKPEVSSYDHYTRPHSQTQQSETSHSSDV